MAISYEGFYQGGASSLNPDYGNFTGYRMNASQLGFPGSPQTPNQLGETVNALKQGVKSFEVTMLQGDTGETIPKQHFEEMRALMKLTGVKPSVHGPMIDAAGFDEKGNWGGEQGRVDNERRMFDTIEKAALLDNNGNVPVVFHSAGVATPGAEFRPSKEWEDGEKIMERGAAINRETGQATAIKREYKFRPGRPDLLDKGGEIDDEGNVKYHGGDAKGMLFDAEGTINSINLGEWEGKLTEVAQMNKHAMEVMGESAAYLEQRGFKDAVFDPNKNVFIDAKTEQELSDSDSDRKGMDVASYEAMKKADIFLENADLSFKSAFHQAYKYGTDKQREELKKLSENYKNGMKVASGRVRLDDGRIVEGVMNTANKRAVLDHSIKELGKLTDRSHGEDFGTPKLFQESNEFAMDKAAKTFGDLAKKSYDKLGEKKAPVIAIEHFHPGAALFETDDVISLIKKSRKNFANALVKDGVSKKKAEKIAEQKIGATWDVGHINMIKKYGFTDKDIVKQTKKAAKYVKHIHLTDNFGFGDTHLAPGMGNVPIKKIMEELEKNGEFGKMRKIVEAGAFVQHFKKSPHSLTMAAFGSPLYSMTQGPYWNQAMDVQGAYFGGYGTINPQQHHSIYGAGFTTMPVELGGQMPGGTSRFGGTPMN